MRTEQHGKDSWARLDKELRKHLKEVLGLPKEANPGYLYGNTDEGCLGIPMAANDADIAVIDSAFKLLMSDDPRVKNLAWQDLQDVTRDRITVNPLISDMEEFLNNKEYEVESRTSTIWSKAREASKRMLVTWNLTDDCKATISSEDSIISDKKKVFSSLRKYFRKSRASELRECPSQGKTNKCLSLAKVSNHFIRTGDFLRFTDWKFVHKARLN